MKTTHYYIAVALGIACVVLAIAVVVIGNGNADLQLRIAQNQGVIGQGAQAQQLGNNLVTAIGQSAGANTALRDLLTRHGVKLEGTNAAPSANP